MRLRRNCKGLTLVETILALALGSVVLGSMGLFFQMGIKTFVKSSHRDELIQHARVAMDRIMHDLRYAKLLELSTNTPDSICRFIVNNLEIDSNVSTAEKIQYSWQKSSSDPILKRVLKREVFNGSNASQGSYIIAGTENNDGISITDFKVTPYSVDPADNLEDNSVANANAEGVRIELELTDADDNTFKLVSSAWMRQKGIP